MHENTFATAGLRAGCHPAEPTLAAGQMPDGSTPEQKAVIAGDPVFHPTRLVLDDVPPRAAAPQILFNGRNLDGWDCWLGYRNFADTYPVGRQADRIESR